MKNSISLFFLIVLGSFVVLLGACTSDKLPEPQVGDCDPTLAYNGLIKPIIDNSCALSGCHVAGGDGPGNYSTYAGMQGALGNGSIESRVVVQRDMPLFPGELTEEEFDAIKCWLQAGFPEN